MSANMNVSFRHDSWFGLEYRLEVGFDVGDFKDKRIENTSNETSCYEYVTRTVYTILVGLSYILGKPDKASIFEVRDVSVLVAF